MWSGHVSIGRSPRAAALAAAVAVAGVVVGAAPVAAAPPAVTDVVVDPTGVAAGAPVPIVVAAADATSVTAEVVVGFTAPTAVPLVDDGTGPDATAGDGTWTGTIAGQPAGTLVRARATAVGPGGQGRYPEADDEAAYRGAVVARPAVDTDLPVVDWYIAPTAHQALVTQIGSKTYRPAVLAIDGLVYDGVRMRLQGGLLTQQQPKKNVRVKMADGHDLVAPWLSERPLEEFILDAEFTDPVGVRAELAWRVADLTGGPTIAHEKVRVERNGAFEGVFTMIEEYDDEWLKANDVEDALLYESEDVAFLLDLGPDALGELWDQKEPEDEPHDALAALAAAVDAPPSDAARRALVDQIDVPAVVDHLALMSVLGSIDTIQHNIWLLQDPDTLRWRPLPWDMDVTLAADGVFFPALPAPLPPSILTFSGALARDPRIVEMVNRRIRTLADAALGPQGVDAWLAELLPVVDPDMVLDTAKWPKGRTRAQDLAQIEAWVDWQRARLDGDWGRPGLVPPAPGPETVVVAEIRATGPAAGDFVELANPGASAVDVSGWTVEGAADATLPSGSVVPAGGRLVVPGSAVSRFAGEVTAGSLGGALPDGGGTLVLRDRGGVERDRVAWSATAPWPAVADGRSIEVADLAADNALPSTWRASPAGGGTPGRGAVTTGLDVTIAADTVFTGPDPVTATVAVTNRGPGARTGVVLSADVTGCSRNLGTLAVGATRSFRCTVPVPAGGSVIPVRATATSTGQPPARSSWLNLMTGLTEPFLGPRPTLRDVRLAAGGGLATTWDAVPDVVPPPELGALGPFLEARALDVGLRSPGVATATTGHRTPLAPTTATVPGTVGAPVHVSAAVAGLLPSRSSVESPAVTPRPSVLWPATSPATWAQRALRVGLRRPPTSAEVTAWTEALGAGTTPASLLDELIAAPAGRWALREAKVARLYTAFFDRPAETGGLEYWSSALASGRSIAWVAESFARSPEFRTRFGAGTDAAFVELVYGNVFGRAPDAAGLDYWVGRLEAGKTRGWVVAAFSESPEGRQRLGVVADPIVIAYALTGAAPTSTEHAAAVAWLRAGGSRLTLVEAGRSAAAFATLA